MTINTMPKRATRKEISEHFNTWQCGYADLQHIMAGYGPWYYNKGIYGWNWDCYVDPEYWVAITTGYRNTVGKEIPREMINNYNNMLEAIYHGPESFEEIARLKDEIRKSFFSTLAGGVKKIFTA